MNAITWFTPNQLAEINLKREIEEKLKRTPASSWRIPGPTRVDKPFVTARNTVIANSILKKI